MDVQSLAREVQTLKRSQRRAQRRSFIVAVVAVMIAALSPIAAFAANFRDLNPGSVHNANINAIADAGITTGCNPGIEYCPNGLVTREEMASFLARTAGVGGNPAVVNARTLNGFFANSLVRTNAGGSGQTATGLNSGNSVIATTGIVTPGPGFVIVTSNVTFLAGTSGTQYNEVAASVADNTNGRQGYAQFAFVGTLSGSAAEVGLSPTWVFQVDGSGPRSFVLLASRNPASTGSVSAYNGAITAVYVPFGPGGAQGAAIEDVPAFQWPTRP